MGNWWILNRFDKNHGPQVVDNLPPAGMYFSSALVPKNEDLVPQELDFNVYDPEWQKLKAHEHKLVIGS